MYKVNRTAKASQDLKKIAFYISLDNPYKALSFTRELIDSFNKQVSIYPRTGVKCKKFYYYIYRNYLIFYKIREQKKEIMISHIIHSSRYNAYKNFLVK